MLPLAPPLPVFPEDAEWARALFAEAARHLGDARLLHGAGRYAAAIASAQKAAELGLKSVLVLDGAPGWWEKLHTTHTPLSDISGHALLKRHEERLKGYNPTLPSKAKELEALAPSRPGAASFSARAGANSSAQTEANPEYPFFSADPDPNTQLLTPAIHSPADYFGEAASRNYFGTAYSLLTALQTLYSAVAAWGVVLPAAL
jgi:hypothetical protein